ncbi:hypothetical protein Y032_0306g2006 [Ancylostoma ceylanicum]|nr:hypothetical protein Y032_0306g2006 [Ancylostoma ceylanicum]
MRFSSVIGQFSSCPILKLVQLARREQSDMGKKIPPTSNFHQSQQVTLSKCDRRHSPNWSSALIPLFTRDSPASPSH